MKRFAFNVLTAGFCMTASFAIQIIGHRGASCDAPENTLSAFRFAYCQNADAVELDVQLTKDGRIVIMHDFDTARVSGVPGKIAGQTFEKLRLLEIGKFGKWRDAGFSEKIPLLEEALALVPAGRRLFIEIKCGQEILPELKNVLHRIGQKPRQAVLIGFDCETMRLAKAAFPDLEVNWNVGRDPATRRFPRIGGLIAKANTARLDGLHLHHGFPINAKFVEQVHRAGLKLYTWTVDDPLVARREAQAGVDGITTNRPGWLRAQLALTT